jgi:O-acetylhomoserine/O-acetylserine sulfhydrylase-like pyridoxal-dependent enzyme
MTTDSFSSKPLHPETLAVRSGTLRSNFNEHSEAIFLTSSFVYANSAEAAEKFANAETGFIYSRFTNPTVSMFQDRLAALEEAEACIATSSGMSAIFAITAAHLKTGDNIVYRENTNVLSYYIIKSIFMFHIVDFFDFIVNNNESSLVFKNSLENIHHYCDLIKNKYNNTRYLSVIDNIEKWFNKCRECKLENITMRMTLLEW